MTFREKLMREHPQEISEDYVGGCSGCPADYDYEPMPATCLNRFAGGCTECWDREMPGMEPVKAPDGLRPCEVDGRRGWFHRFVEEERGLLQIDVFMRCESVALAERTFKETGVIPPGCSMEKVRHAWALVEFLDGSVKKVEPETVRFTDGEGQA